MTTTKLSDFVILNYLKEWENSGANYFQNEKLQKRLEKVSKDLAESRVDVSNASEVPQLRAFGSFTVQWPCDPIEPLR